MLLTSWPNRKPADLPWNPDSEQTGVISTSTRHFDFPPSGRLSRSPRTRLLAAQPRLRAAQRCVVVVVLSDLPKRLRCQVRILLISPRKGKEVQMYLPFSYVCNAFVQDQLRTLSSGKSLNVELIFV